MKISKFKELAPRNITIGKSLDLFHSLGGYTAKCKSTSEMSVEEQQDEVIRRLKAKPHKFDWNWALALGTQSASSVPGAAGASGVADMIQKELDKEIIAYIRRTGGAL